MKKILALLLVAVMSLSVLAACGDNDPTTNDTTGTTTTQTDTETTDTETTEPSSDTGSETGTVTTEPGSETHDGEFDTEDAEEVALGYLTEDDKTTGLTSRRTGSIEFVFTIDGDTYGGTLGLEYPLYDWIVDVTDSDGKTTRINVGYDFDFIADEDTGIIKAYFGIETAGFVPNTDDDYTVTVYGVDEYGCAYFGTADVTAKLGYDENDEIVRQPQYLPFAYYSAGKPYEDHHDAAPHEGRVVYVIELTVDDISMFSAANILTFFDLIMYVDGEDYEIAEISGWNTGETSVGLRLGVEAAGFKPEEKGQVNAIRFEIREKGTDRVLFEIEESNVVSNYPIGITVDPGRPEGEKYDPENITAVSGPAGFNEAEGPAAAFDGDIATKLCTPDISTEPLVFTTAESIKLGSISLVTANDNVQYGGRVPTGFKLEGSADGTTWEVLLNLESVQFENLDDFKEYNFAIPTGDQGTYSNYRITFTGTGTVQFSEIELYEA